MMECVNGTLPDAGRHEREIEMAVFASTNIYDYAAHSLMVMSYYAERHGYGLRLLGVETGDDFSPEDRRWNKIKSVTHALIGWAAHAKVLVYYDADLVVTELDSFTIESVLRDNPAANLIMSADALDVANTGFIVMRNSQWTLDFFASWWAAKDSHLTFCDQHVLNKLYSDLPEEERTNIAILPPNALNSRWPAIETFDSSTDRVLHLMGETHPYRVSTFEHASAAVCSWDPAEDGRVQRRLDFSRAVLIGLAKKSLWEDRERVLEQCAAAAEVKEKTDAVDDMVFQTLHEATTHICDDRRPYVALTHSECRGLFQEVYHVNLGALEARDMASTATASRMSNTDRVFFLDQMTKALYGIIYFSDDADKPEATQKFMRGLELLEQHIDMHRPENLVYVNHKRAILHSSLAQHGLERGDPSTARREAARAVELMEHILDHVARDAPDFPGFVLEYIESAASLAKALRVDDHLDDALHWVQVSRANAQVLYSSYSGEGRVIARNLADLHVLEAGLLESLGRTEDALASLDAARRAFTAFEITELPREVAQIIAAAENRIGMRRIMESII